MIIILLCILLYYSIPEDRYEINSISIFIEHPKNIDNILFFHILFLKGLWNIDNNKLYSCLFFENFKIIVWYCCLLANMYAAKLIEKFIF